VARTCALSEAVLDRAAEGAPDVLDVLVGATLGEGLEALHHLGRGVVPLGVGQQGLAVGRERAGGEEPGDVGPGLGVVQVEGGGRGPPPGQAGVRGGLPLARALLLAVLLDPALDRRTLLQRAGLVVQLVVEPGAVLVASSLKVSAPPGRYCFLPMASASSALLMRERPLTPSFRARSYNSCLVLPTASTPV
jgi:hypothetical protein